MTRMKSMAKNVAYSIEEQADDMSKNAFKEYDQTKNDLRQPYEDVYEAFAKHVRRFINVERIG